MKLNFFYNGGQCCWNGNFNVYDKWPASKQKACVAALRNSRNDAYIAFYNTKRADADRERFEERNRQVIQTLEAVKNPATRGSIPQHILDLALEGMGVVGDCQCAICLEDLSDVATIGVFKRCGHVLHYNCIEETLNAPNRDIRNKCPICRQHVGGMTDVHRLGKKRERTESDMSIRSVKSKTSD
jgi:hypothetical protein